MANFKRYNFTSSAVRNLLLQKNRIMELCSLNYCTSST